jgi:flagellar hook protein FlgE
MKIQGGQAIYQAQSQLNKTSHKMAAQKGDLATNITDTMKADKLGKAGAKVVQAKDEMLGSVIDLKA